MIFYLFLLISILISIGLYWFLYWFLLISLLIYIDFYWYLYWFLSWFLYWFLLISIDFYIVISILISIDFIQTQTSILISILISIDFYWFLINKLININETTLKKQLKPSQKIENQRKRRKNTTKVNCFSYSKCNVWTEFFQLNQFLKTLRYLKT